MIKQTNEAESAMIATASAPDCAPAESGRKGSFAARAAKVTMQVIFPLALLIWIARFWQSGRFGLYEDDWGYIPGALGIGWHAFSKLIGHDLALGTTQGRPVGIVLIHLLSFLGYKAGGLQGLEVIAFLILLTNAVLFYLLLNKAFGDRRFAILGAIGFALFPADTTQAFLVHGLGVQPAVTLLLVAVLLYLSGWRISSYIAILLSLLTYETPFLVFAAAPLMRRHRRSDIVKHWAIMAAILACVIPLRAASAESRVEHIGIADLLLGAANVIAGPVTCLLMYFYRPVQALAQSTGYELLLLCLCCSGLWLFARYCLSIPAAVKRATKLRSPDQSPWSPFRIGILMLLAAYPLTLTTVGISISGRGTRVHLAAILGASIIFAWAASRLLDRLRLGASVGALCVAVYCALLVGFGWTVQRDYVRGWQEQRGFWTDLVTLCPDLHDGDAIFVEPTGLRDTRQLLFLRKDLYGVPDTRQIKSLDIVRPVLRGIYAFPRDWRNPPAVYRLPRNWERQLFADDANLRLISIEGESGEITPGGESRGIPAASQTVPASRAIFLETKNGRLTRRTDIMNPLTGDRVLLKQENRTAAARPTALPMYRYLMIRPDEKPVPYLVTRP